MRFRLTWLILGLLPAPLSGCGTAPESGPPPPLCDAPCEEFATFDGWINDIAFDAKHVAALIQNDDGQQEIAVVPITGGAPKTVFRTREILVGVALLDGFLFVEELPNDVERPATIRSISLDSGAMQIRAKVKFDVLTGLIAARRWVVVTGVNGVTALSIDGTKAPMFEGGSQAVPIALDAQNLYTYSPGGEVFASPRTANRTAV